MKVDKAIYHFESFSDYDLAAAMILYIEKEAFQRKIP